MELLKKIKLTNKLFIFGVLLEIVFLLFFLVEPLRAFLGDTSLVLSDYYLTMGVVCLLLIALLIYVQAANILKKENAQYYLIIVGFFVLFNLTFLFIWPIGSVDVFAYIAKSRVLSIHSINPYLVPYDNFPHDIFYNQIRHIWTAYPFIYAPLFVVIGSILTFLGGNSLFFTLFLFKLFFIVVNFLNVYLIHKIFKNNFITFLYAWNPLILFDFALNAHNDVLTILFILLSIFFLYKGSNIKNYSISFLFLLLSVFIKYTTAIFLPIFFLIILFKLRKKREQINFTLISIIIGIVIPIVLCWPFWSGLQIFSTLISGLSLNGFAPFILFIASFLRDLGVDNYFELAKMLSKIIFLCLYIVIICIIYINRFRLTKHDILKYFFIVYLFFIITFLSWVMPWYYTIPIVLLICYLGTVGKKDLDSNKYYYIYNFITILTIYGILHYLIIH